MKINLKAIFGTIFKPAELPLVTNEIKTFRIFNGEWMNK